MAKCKHEGSATAVAGVFFWQFAKVAEKQKF